MGQVQLSGTVKLDGSSTVFPISEAMAEEFQAVHRNVKVTVGLSGTGGGFEKFCRGEVDIANASRPIKKSETELCTANHIEFVELPVAFDGLSVVINPKNDWVDHLTVEELKRIWEPGSTVKRWSDVRTGWPQEEIVLAGAGTDSGTFDYFTAAVVGEERASRPDYIASEDDNVLVQAVSDSIHALGYFGYAYYAENAGRLKVVPIDQGDGKPVAPSIETINNGTYRPLSRPLFIYVSRSASERAEVQEFVRYHLSEEGIPLVSQVGYVELPEKIYTRVRERFEGRILGSVFAGGSQVGVTIEELLAQGR
jgi:phosphate transport system substrate-binding protein